MKVFMRLLPKFLKTFVARTMCTLLMCVECFFNLRNFCEHDFSTSLWPPTKSYISVVGYEIKCTNMRAIMVQPDM